MIIRTNVLVISFLLTATFSVFAGEVKKTGNDLRRGEVVFQQTCQWCHGAQGNGKGPAAFFLGAYSSPRPRDFTVGNYKLRSTPADEFPTDQDGVPEIPLCADTTFTLSRVEIVSNIERDIRAKVIFHLDAGGLRSLRKG